MDENPYKSPDCENGKMVCCQSWPWLCCMLGLFLFVNSMFVLSKCNPIWELQFYNGFNAETWWFVLQNHFTDPYKPMVLVGAITFMLAYVAFPTSFIMWFIWMLLFD